MSSTVQRLAGGTVLVVTGVLSLPVAASFLDGPGIENWIFPVQLLAMTLIGAAVTVALPALARAGAPVPRRAIAGGGWGLLAAFIGVLVFWLLLNGFHGA
jgi:hypothetical protein